MKSSHPVTQHPPPPDSYAHIDPRIWWVGLKYNLVQLDLPKYPSRDIVESTELITWLPYEDFVKCAVSLHTRELGKQRVQASQIIRAIAGHSPGWLAHPAVRMWHGHLGFLVQYFNTMCMEWAIRGHSNFGIKPSREIPVRHVADFARDLYRGGYPPWLGDPDINSSHRSLLLGKNEEHYGKHGWAETPATTTKTGVVGSWSWDAGWPK